MSAVSAFRRFRLARELPLLRHLRRSRADIEAQARRLLARVSQALAVHASVSAEPCESQVGSGSLPGDALPSFALAVRPRVARRQAPARVEQLSRMLRALPVPVIGRVHSGVLLLDLRCLEDEALLLAQLDRLPGNPKKH